MLIACGSGRDEGFEEVDSIDELEELLESEYADVGGGATLDVLPRQMQVAFGDLPTIRKRGVLRVLISPSRTNYFIDGGTERGFEYELMREYWRRLDRRTPGRFVMVVVPAPFERLLPDLIAGRGDIAAAGITVTSERQRRVSFTDPYISDVHEVVVGHLRDVEPDSLPELAGRTIHVVRGSSYERHILELNEELISAGNERIEVARAPPYLEAEDLLELLDRGLIELTVVDEHIAELWSSVLPNIVIYEHMPIREGGEIAWAIRKEDRKLREDLSAFAQRHRKGSRFGNIFFKRYFVGTKWIAGASDEDGEWFHRIQVLLEKYADEYEFDWLFLAAVAYQESRLDQSARSRRGAVGLFQVRPAIAAAEPIGIDNVTTLENNVHAGVRYLAHIRDHYLDDPELSEAARKDLMLASYNAGPTRIRRLRKQAAARGYDPDVWFGNVERLAGHETIRYVANVNRRYYAFKLTHHTLSERSEVVAGIED